MRKPGVLLILLSIAFAGCEEAPSQPPPQAAAPPSGPPMPAPAAAPVPAPPAVAQSTISPASDPAVAPPTDRVKAETGVGKKGRGYGGGIVTEPIHQYFLAGQTIAFNIQIPNGMKAFEAEHNRKPKDWAEFKREILDPANIVLPDLPNGDKYVYDAQTGELMVERRLPGGPAE